MRIVITADLHYAPAHVDRYRAFAREVEALEPDCFVIAGDVGWPMARFRASLRLFASLPCPRLVLAGNHDLYAFRGVDSRALWERWLPQAAREEGFAWLEDEPLVLGRTAICGTLAWYDYSSAPAHLALEPHDYRVLKTLVNHDADYITWPWSDRAMARYLLRRFAARVGAIQATQEVTRIVVVTHIPPFAETIPVHPQSERWSLLSAYLGNFTLGEWLRAQPKVTHVVSGHIHRAGRWTVAGVGGPIHFEVVGSLPGAPVCVVIDVE